MVVAKGTVWRLALLDGWLWLQVQFGVGCGYRYRLAFGSAWWKVMATGTVWSLALLNGRLRLQVQFVIWPCLMEGCDYSCRAEQRSDNERKFLKTNKNCVYKQKKSLIFKSLTNWKYRYWKKRTEMLEVHSVFGIYLFFVLSLSHLQITMSTFNINSVNVVFTQQYLK